MELHVGAGKYTVYDSDTSVTETDEYGDHYYATYANPRVQTDMSLMLCEDLDRYIFDSIQVPSDCPSLPSEGWAILGSYGYAEPWTGNAPLALAVLPNDTLVLRISNDDYAGHIVWSKPLTKGTWIDLAVYEYFSKDDARGFLEVWYNGTPQTLTDPDGTTSTRITFSTLKRDSTSCGNFYVGQYRAKGSISSSATVYHDQVKIGDTHSVV